MKLDWKLTLIALGSFILLSPIFSTVHEYGHAYVCWINGYDYSINPTLLGTYFFCEKFQGDSAESIRFSMWIAGGMIASMSAFSVFALGKGLGIFRGRAKGIAYALVTIGLMHFIQMILEAYFHDFYMEGKFTIPIMAMTSLIVLMVLLFRGSQQFIDYPKTFTNPPYDSGSKFNPERRDIPQSIFKRDIRDIIKGNKPKPKRTTDVDLMKSKTAEDLLGDNNE